MKKFLIVSAVLLALTAIVAILTWLTSEKVDEDLVGVVLAVEWPELNVRDDAGEDTTVIKTLEEGDLVELTGVTKEIKVGSPHPETWVEIEGGHWVLYEGLSHVPVN